MMAAAGCDHIAAIDQLINACGYHHLRGVITTAEHGTYEQYMQRQERIRILNELMSSWPHDRLGSSAERVLSLCGAWAGSDRTFWSQCSSPVVGVASVRELREIGGIGNPPGRADHLRLVLRRYDLPGRLNGYDVFDPDGNCTFIASDNGDPAEGGLTMSDHLDFMGDVVYGIDDPLLAAALQVNSLAHSQTWLPIVAWKPSTAASWSYIQARRMLLWSNRPGWDLFRQARQIPDSQVSLRLYTEYQLRRTRQEPLVFLDELRKDAVPWADALRRTLLKLHDIELRNWLSRLQLTSVEWDMLLSGCESRYERKRLQAYARLPDPARMLTMGHWKVIERDGCWWVIAGNGTEQLLTDVTFRVATILHHEATKHTYMSGTIFYRGNTLPFRVDEKLLASSPAEFLRETVIRQGLGYPTFLRNMRQINLLDLALRFGGEPSVVVDTGRVGWCAKRQQWILPKVAVSADSITDGDPLLTSPEMMPSPAVIHRNLVPDDLQRLTDPRLVMPLAAYWATFTAVLYNAVAKLFEVETRPIGVVGLRDSIAGAALRTVRQQWGLLEMTLGGSPAGVSELLAMEAAHDLPVSLSLREGYPKTMRIWLDDDSPKNAILLVSPLMSRSLALYQRWNFVVCPSHPDEDLPLIQGLIPAILQRCIRWAADIGQADEKLTLPRVMDQAKLFILSLAGDDWQRRQDATAVFSAAQKMIKSDSPESHRARRAQRWLDLVMTMAETGSMKFGSKADKAATVKYHKGTVTVHPKALALALQKMGLPPPPASIDWAEVLHDAGVLEPQSDTLQGLTIKAEVWKRINAERREKRAAAPTAKG